MREQVLGQLAVDDPAVDDAERLLLTDLGFAALLMVPVVAGGVSVGLLTLATLALIWHEPSAPQWAWLNLIAVLAVLKVMPQASCLP